MAGSDRGVLGNGGPVVKSLNLVYEGFDADLAVDVDVPVGQLGERLPAVSATVGSLVSVQSQMGAYVKELREAFLARHALKHLLHAAGLGVVTP